VTETPPLHGGFGQVGVPDPPSFGGAEHSQETGFCEDPETVHELAQRQAPLINCWLPWQVTLPKQFGNDPVDPGGH